MLVTVLNMAFARAFDYVNSAMDMALFEFSQLIESLCCSLSVALIISHSFLAKE